MFLMMPNVYHVENKMLETGDSDFLIFGLLFRLSKQWNACRDLYSYKFSIHSIVNLMENASIALWRYYHVPFSEKGTIASEIVGFIHIDVYDPATFTAIG